MQEAATHLQGGRLGPAARLAGQARAAAPRSFEPLWISGVIALRQERLDEASAWLGKAHALCPSHGACALRLGFALARLGRHADAEAALRAAVALLPEDAEAWDTLGYVLRVRGSLRESIEAHRRSAGIQPGRSLSWHNLGNALLFAGRPAEALEAQERAAQADPGSAPALHGRAIALQACHRIPEAIKGYGEALKACETHHASRSHRLMALNYLDGIGRGEMFAEHAAFGAAVRQNPRRSFPNLPDAGRRLRVAFLSPDLRTHSVAYFLEPLLTHLEKGQFEIFLYHDHFVEDAVSERLRLRADTWRNFIGLPDAAVEQAIRGDAPDILVDLAGHTGLNRLPLLSRRLAPVQVGYLGYPNTSGIEAMDYRFVDAITDPQGDADPLHTESLVRFAPTAWAYAPPSVAPSPAPPPSHAGAPITFGSFNNFAKVTDTTMLAWSKLLAAVHGARLRIKCTGLDEAPVMAQVRERLVRADIDPGCVELVGRDAGLEEHLARYRDIDVALDTFPYNGTTTTCEALWMGVPVVTLSGDRHAARVGASLLTAIGRPEWIARSWDQYGSIAAGLARDREGRREIGRSLRPAMARSPLLDHRGQAERFGHALRECWAVWCQRAAVAA